MWRLWFCLLIGWVRSQVTQTEWGHDVSELILFIMLHWSRCEIQVRWSASCSHWIQFLSSSFRAEPTLSKGYKIWRLNNLFYSIYIFYYYFLHVRNMSHFRNMLGTCRGVAKDSGPYIQAVSVGPPSSLDSWCPSCINNRVNCTN